MIFAVSSAQFYFAISFACFCNKFCLDFTANICVYFQYLFMHVVCANIFGANVLKPRFKIGASKIKVKNVNKKRMATARRLIFFGISQGIHC